jgi:hypothetical protein
MFLDVERARVLAKLPDLDTRGKGTGAILLYPDSRLRSMESISQFQMRRFLPQGIPTSYHELEKYVEGVYDQDGWNACVAYSIAGMQSVIERKRFGHWYWFDAFEVYSYCGGAQGNTGISATCALDFDVQTGLADKDTQTRHHISDYAFANPMTPSGVELIKASVATGYACVLALLLPQDFGNPGPTGACNSNVVTNGYHQICIVGYDEKRFTLLNSWGDGWGDKGLGSIPWAFVQRPEQSGFAYAYTVTYRKEPGFTPFFASEIASFHQSLHNAGGQYPVPTLDRKDEFTPRRRS